MRNVWLSIGLVVLAALVVGCAPLGLAQQTEWLFSPPWEMSDKNQGWSGSARDTKVQVEINPADGKGLLGVLQDNERKRADATASGSFFVGGKFTPPVSGVYEFVFVYEYNGSGKVEYGGLDYRCGAVVGVTAVVGEVESTSKTIWFRSTKGGEAELLDALKATANAVLSAVSKKWKDVVSGAADVFKAFQSKSDEEVLQGTERISVVATLDSGTTYPFYVLTAGAVRVRASEYSKARASFGLHVRLVEVQVKRRTAGTGGIQPGTGGTQPGTGPGGVIIIITPPPGTPGLGGTDPEGKFSLPLSVANTRASGQLSTCGQVPVPLANQSVTVTVLPVGATSAADITGLVVSVPGYKPRSATGMFVLTVGGITQFYLGSLCLEREEVAPPPPPPPVVTEPPKADEVAWSAKKPLSWGDFRGTVPADSIGRPEAAEAALELRYDYDYVLRYDVSSRKWKARVASVTAENVMDRDLSWVDLRRATDVLLNHVQRHFDLNEVYRRVLEAALLGLEGVGDGREAAEASLERQVDAISDAILAVLSALQAQYDEETDHGRNVAAQALWDGLIDGWLADPSTVPLP